MATPSFAFKKAVKKDARGRLALIGPAGSGKSYTMLKLARQLAGPEGRIAAIDTEHGSLSKYADSFDFDVIELDSFSPTNFMAALDAAENGGYTVFCCDSLSHFWTGKDGALEFVDMAGKRHRDNMGGWKDFRPHERQMVDRMVASPCHVIVTMRTKNDYVDEVNQQTGKKQRRKVGLAPVQREGLEYEFDFVGYMDEDNTMLVDKTRCSFYQGKAITKPAEKDFAPFCDWLKGEKPAEQPKPAQQPAQQQSVAQAEEPKQPASVQQPQAQRSEEDQLAVLVGKVKGRCKYLKDHFAELGQQKYGTILRESGVNGFAEIKTVDKANELINALGAGIKELEAAKKADDEAAGAAA